MCCAALCCAVSLCLSLSCQVVVGDPEVDGFRLKLVDTCGLEDPEAGDTVNYMVRGVVLGEGCVWVCVWGGTVWV